MLRLYREALRIRRSDAALGDAPLSWQPSRRRGARLRPRLVGVRCVANLSAAPVALPPHASVLLASGPLDDGLLPPDTTVWLRIAVTAS